MAQPVAFFEVTSTDHERVQKFYCDLFGWTLTADPSHGGYAQVDTGEPGAIPGGIGPADSAADAGARFYVRVDDLDAYISRAEQLGGRCVVPPTELPDDFGLAAVIADPDGNSVGLWA